MDLSLGIKWTCLWALSGLDLGLGVRKGLDRVSSGFVFGYQVDLSVGIKWTCSGTKWTCLWVPSGFVLGYEVDLCKNKSTSYPRTTLTGPDPKLFIFYFIAEPNSISFCKLEPKRYIPFFFNKEEKTINSSCLYGIVSKDVCPP